MSIRRGRATSRDVARAAGVSQATVSRCFNDSDAVSIELRLRVLEVAKQLGYHRNAHARSLVRGRSSNVAVISGDLGNPFYALALDGITRRLRDARIGVLHFVSDSGEDVDTILSQVLEQQVDGIIVTAIALHSTRLSDVLEQGLPIVLFNRTLNDSGVSFVASDSIGGGRLAASLLVGSGHNRIGYIGGGLAASTEVERFEGFSSGLRNMGHREPIREEGRFTYEGGYSAALRMLSQASRPDAIFCANDMMALGAMDAARGEMGLRIPDDLSILGYGDVPVGSWPSYALTTIQPKLTELVELTVRVLLSLFQGGTGQIQQLHVPPNLVLRKSVRGVNTWGG